MSYIMTDTEADGPIPGPYSMIAIGAVVVRPGLQDTFHTNIKPISDKWVPEALAVSGFTREQTLAFEDPYIAMKRFSNWVKTVSNGRPRFISDNNGFDWMWTCWYLWQFAGENPFGYSSTNLGSLYKGFVQSDFKNFKHLRKTKHDHNPVHDAIGNAESLLKIKEMGMIITLD